MSFRIAEVWAYVAIGDDDEEGVCGANIGPGGSMLPLIGTDRVCADDLLPMAQDIAAATGMVIKLIKFSVREEIATIDKRQ
jgi:hypothetical protein